MENLQFTDKNPAEVKPESLSLDIQGLGVQLYRGWWCSSCGWIGLMLRMLNTVSDEYVSLQTQFR